MHSPHLAAQMCPLANDSSGESDIYWWHAHSPMTPVVINCFPLLYHQLIFCTVTPGYACFKKVNFWEFMHQDFHMLDEVCAAQPTTSLLSKQRTEQWRQLYIIWTQFMYAQNNFHVLIWQRTLVDHPLHLFTQQQKWIMHGTEPWSLQLQISSTEAAVSGKLVTTKNRKLISSYRKKYSDVKGNLTNLWQCGSCLYTVLDSFYPSDAMLARSLRQQRVCPSVTRRYCA